MSDRAPAGPLPEDVRRLLVTASLGRRIYFYPEVASTNDVALDLARRGEPEGTIVVADFQREGRGRRGRVWTAPPGGAVLVSLVLRPERSPRDALPAALVVALAVSVALSKLLDVEVGVKWPNDVVAPQGKIAGILAESVTGGERLAYLVVGLGINVNTPADGLPEGAASCRSLTGDGWDRAMLLADVLGSIESYYDRFRREGFGPLVDATQSRLIQMGRTVAFERAGTRLAGRVAGLAEDGALRVDVGGDEMRLYTETAEVIA